MALTPSQVEHYRRRLVARRDELVGGAAHGEHAAAEGLLREVSGDTDEIWQMEAALARMSDGTYGICEHCGCEIPESRLDASPSALMCARDQEISDQNRRVAGLIAGGEPSRVVL